MAASSEHDQALSEAARIILGSKYVIALVGAGLSVESGIPPFRGPGGLWTKLGEPDSLGYERFTQDPKKWWEDRLLGDSRMAGFAEAMEAAKPNPGHHALTELEQMGLLRHVITQNVDNLHRVAGSQSLSEIHGNRYRLRCISCSYRWDQRALSLDELPPRCPYCGGLVKSDTVMFGEPIPSDVLATCYEQAQLSDCVLSIGTSAQVYPAAQFPVMVKRAGGAIIEVNPYETAITNWCDIALRGPSGEALPALVQKLRELGGLAGRP